MRSITIFHTNDLHGKLNHAKAEAIAAMKSTCQPCLLLDAGDAVSSGNIYYRPGGEPILNAMSELGYDAMAMGNREFHFLAKGLESKTKSARFPILCANLRTDHGLRPSAVQPSALVECSGVKVGIFGLTVPMITQRMFARKFSPFWFEDPIAAAEAACSELKPQAEVLVALTHIGIEDDVKLAERVRGIDLIVSGHTHLALAEPRLVLETPIVQAGWWARYIGRVEMRVDESGGRLADFRLIQLPH